MYALSFKIHHFILHTSLAVCMHKSQIETITSYMTIISCSIYIITPDFLPQYANIVLQIKLHRLHSVYVTES